MNDPRGLARPFPAAGARAELVEARTPQPPTAGSSARSGTASNLARRLVVAALTMCALGAGAAAHAADSIAGPQLGNVRYRGEIKTTEQGEDEDVFAGPLLAGERLSLRIVTVFQSGLYPELVVEGPDGTPRQVGLRTNLSGKVVASRRPWIVPETGRWTVRVRPRFQSQGTYTLAIGIRRSETARIDVAADKGGATPADVDLPFEAVAGFGLQLTAKAKNGGRTAPEISDLTDAAGETVRDAEGVPVVASVKKKRGTATLTVAALAAGEGTYHARIAAPAGHRAFVVTARVDPRARARGSRKLSADEPWMAPRSFLLRGVTEGAVQIEGLNFSTKRPPVVLFGDLKGTNVVVESFGTSLDVTPPQLDGGQTVRVAVVNPDGQAFERPAFFQYVAKPRVDDIVDLQGVRVRGSSTAGGRKVRFLGAGFQTGQVAQFGASDDVLPQIISSVEIELKIPAQPPGVVDVHLKDAYFHDFVIPGFEYKDPPSIAFAPYQPATAAGDGSAQVVILGDGFSDDDIVMFDGKPVTTMWFSQFALRFDVPVADPGLHDVAVRDRVGSISSCPQFTIE